MSTRTPRKGPVPYLNGWSQKCRIRRRTQFRLSWWITVASTAVARLPSSRTILKLIRFTCSPPPAITVRFQPMAKPAFILMVALNLFFLGCSGEPLPPGGPAGKSDAFRTSVTSPQSSENSPPAFANRAPQERPLVIDLSSHAELGGVIRCIFQDSKGVLWVGGEGDLFRNDGQTVTSYDLRDDLGNRVTIKQIIEDGEGHIWCGTTGGVTRIEGESFTSFGEQHGLLNRDVWSIAADGNGTLWIGTIEGVCRFDGKDFSEFSIPESKPDPTRGVTSSRIVHCVTVDRKGRVWFGTNGGAYIYDGQRLANISVSDGLPDDVVHNILEDSAGNVWIGTTHNGICRFDGNTFTNFTADKIVDGKEIWCIHEDSSGHIWFSGKRIGMYRYDGLTFKHFDESDGLTSPGLMSILKDANGRLWLGGVHGLFRYDGNAFVQVTEKGPWE